MREPMRVLLIIYAKFLSNNAVRDHIESFSRSSHHDWRFVCYSEIIDKTREELSDAFAAYDAVFLHFSVRPAQGNTRPQLSDALRVFSGTTGMMVQDEYFNIRTTRKWIRESNIDIVVSVTPEPDIAKIYPPDEFDHTRFVSVPVGFIPLDFESSTGARLAGDMRPMLCVYRGNDLGPQYGDLGQEKRIIGERMQAEFVARKLPCNIDWASAARIYGSAWYAFLESGKWCLGTEGGSNLYDMDGVFGDIIQAALDKNPDASYDELRALLPPEENIGVRSNKITTRIFEACALKTGLVLFEGEYSGAIEPGVHYLPLKKDFSNVGDIIEKMQDDALRNRMAEAAYTHIFSNPDNFYAAMTEDVDDALRVSRNHDHAPDKTSGIGALLINLISLEMDKQQKRVREEAKTQRAQIDTLRAANVTKTQAINRQTVTVDKQREAITRLKGVIEKQKETLSIHKDVAAKRLTQLQEISGRGR